MDYVEATFRGGEVRLDGNKFDKCVFENTVLCYDGGPVHLSGCTFEGVAGWDIGGNLASGLSVLGQLYTQDHEQGLRIVCKVMFAHLQANSAAANAEEPFTERESRVG